MLKENRVCGKSNGNLDMTAISVFYDAGVNPLRKTATMKAVQHWMMQSHLPDEFLFLELGFDGQFTFSEDDFPEQIHYIRIDGTERNKYLFQKEHLWNIAAKMATYEKLMFIDSDMSPLDDQDWFRRVYRTLDKCIFAQGFNALVYLNQNDTPSNTIKYSYFSCVVKGNNTSNSKYMNPGGVYCISKQFLLAMGGFNYLPLGGGDDLFLLEIGCKCTSQPWCEVCKRRYVEGIANSCFLMLNKDFLGNVDVGVCHFYHGDFTERSYNQRQFMLLTQYPWNGRLIQEGENGLAEWSNPQHWFVDIAKNFKSINNSEANVSKMMKQNIDYIAFKRDVMQLISSSLFHIENIHQRIIELVHRHTLNKSIDIETVDMPLVSVIVPCYNSEKYIDQCLESIFDNGYSNIEVICVDDRSTDSTLEHIKQYQTRCNNIIVCTNQSQRQLYGGGARNLGMVYARGKYIYFCDSDDYILPGLFKACVQKCESSRSDICMFFHNRYNEKNGKIEKVYNSLNFDALNTKDQTIFNRNTAKNIFCVAWGMVWDKFYNREFIQRIGCRFGDMRNAEDSMFHFKSFLNADRITYIDKAFYIYRCNNENSVQEKLFRGDSQAPIIESYQQTFDYVKRTFPKNIVDCYKIWFGYQMEYFVTQFNIISKEFLDRLVVFLKELDIYENYDIQQKMNIIRKKPII